MEYQRRNWVPLGTLVLIRPENEIFFSQKRYLSLIDNKVGFISYLSDQFRQAGICVVNCPSDADAQTERCTLELSNAGFVLVVEDDSDIILLLLYH